MGHSIMLVSTSSKYHTLGVVICDDEHNEENREREVLETNGKIHMAKSKSLIFRSLNFHIVTIHNKLRNPIFVPIHNECGFVSMNTTTNL